MKLKIFIAIGMILAAGFLTVATAFLPRSSEYASPDELWDIWSGGQETILACAALMPSCGYFEGGTKKTSGYPVAVRTVYQEDDYVVKESWDRQALLINYLFYLTLSSVVVYFILKKNANHRN